MAKKKSEDDFGKRLKEARLLKGLTQAQAAEASGMSQGNWSDIEAGRVGPGLDVARRMAKAVGVKLGKLVD